MVGMVGVAETGPARRTRGLTCASAIAATASENLRARAAFGVAVAALAVVVVKSSALGSKGVIASEGIPGGNTRHSLDTHR